MAKKFLVFITHGVYVDTPDDIDPDTEQGWTTIVRGSIEALIDRTVAEMIGESDFEIEEVTEEFENE